MPQLAAAVSNAGGLGAYSSEPYDKGTPVIIVTGILTALSQPNPEALRQAIRKTRSLTQNSFGVNITLLPTINPPDYAGYARAAVEEGVKIFETATCRWCRARLNCMELRGHPYQYAVRGCDAPVFDRD